MQITKEWLKEKSACKDGYEWSVKVLNDKPMDVFKFLDLLVKDDRWLWANWVIVRVMTRPQYLRYAIFSAECVIDIYEKKYPKIDAPRKAIKAAKAVLKDDTEENRTAAKTAYEAASAVAYEENSAAVSAAASVAAYAAYAAAYEAVSAA